MRLIIDRFGSPFAIREVEGEAEFRHLCGAYDVKAAREHALYTLTLWDGDELIACHNTEPECCP